MSSALRILYGRIKEVFEPNRTALEETIKEELEQGMVSRETAATVFCLIASDGFSGCWPPQVTPYMLGVAMRRLVGTQLSPEEVLGEVLRGYYYPLHTKFDPKKVAERMGEEWPIPTTNS